jgi:hypothetical protein
VCVSVCLCASAARVEEGNEKRFLLIMSIFLCSLCKIHAIMIHYELLLKGISFLLT